MSLPAADAADSPSAPPAPPARPASGPWRIAVAVASDIKLAHSVFAMPFAVLAMFLAAAQRPAPADPLPTLAEVVLIVVCMVAARTAAMAMNRWADARIDAVNPRTRARAVPSGRVSPHAMLAAVAIASVAFLLASAGFYLVNGNLWPTLLAPVVLAWLLGYSFAKRFTRLCHLWLGIALALSPLAAAIAIQPAVLARLDTAPAFFLLAAFVAAWVAGFDILYAMQDTEIDRRDGLHSLPGRLGIGVALWVSRGLHALAAIALLAIPLAADPNATVSLGQNASRGLSLFNLAALATVGLLVYEHSLVARRGSAGIPTAFLTVNGVISIVLGLAGVADVLLASRA